MVTPLELNNWRYSPNIYFNFSFWREV